MGYHSRPPAFLDFLGVEAPTSADLGIYPSKEAIARWIEEHPGQVLPDPSLPRQFPLHRKPVLASIRYKDILRECNTLPCHDSLAEAYRWLYDPRKYEELSRDSPNPLPDESKVRLHNTDVEAWIKDGKVTLFEGTPRSFVHAFSVIEMEKLRRRGICEPYINMLIKRMHLAGIKLPSRRTIRRMLHRCQKATAIDAAAFYDQFPLHKDVQPYFVFEYLGNLYSFTVLPMGFRPSADIAQLTAMAVLQLTRQDHATAYIDNFIFTGPQQENDVTRFLNACKRFELHINETPDWKWTASLSKTELDFIGESYDLKAQTKSSTNKTKDKLKRARDILERYNCLVSAKTVASVFGILIYASPSHDISLSSKFQCMRYLGHLGRTTRDWNAPALPIDASTMDGLQKWIQELETTGPTPIHGPPPDKHDVEIQVDASAYGWGAVIISSEGSISTISEPWPRGFDASSSSVAEPQAAWFAICRAVTKDTKRVLLRTDHLNLVHAFNRGHSRTLAYNMCVEKVYSIFPTLHVDAQFIAGLDNFFADALSRNKDTMGMDKRYQMNGRLDPEG